MKLRTLPIYLSFLAMGFGDAVGPFVGLAKTTFELSNTMALIIPFMGFIMFGILSVPMGIFQDRKGKKTVLLIGLIIAFLGLIIPMFGLTSFYLFLVTVLFLGGGATILQVAGNPIMRDVSEEGKYSRNLAIGQFVKAIGSLAGPVIPPVAAAIFGAGWEVVFPIFSISLLITIIAVASLNVEEKEASETPASFKSCLALLSNGYVAAMVFGIFLYVGAEVSMSSGIPLYLESEFGINIEKLGVLGSGLFFTAILIGRGLGGIILNWIKPKPFLVVTTIISVIAILGLFLGSQVVAIVSVILIGLGFANIFPLIFSITVDHMPEKTNELSGLMITAIVGGAFVPPIMGVVADYTSVLFGFVVPLLAIIYVTAVAISNLKHA